MLTIQRALSCAGILVLGAAASGATTGPASSPASISDCNSKPLAPACGAVRGERAEGWLAQSRSPVLARNGVVVTSQPLAAQAGLRILMAGGNAIDAAVATAAALNVTE